MQSMMRSLLTLAIALGVLTAAARLTAQQPSQPKPGPEHELLKQAEGTWDMTFKSGDDKGTTTCKLGLGGLWLFDDAKASFGGSAFEGRGATSYDPHKKKYINIWIDSMSTSPLISEGTYDKSTKTMTLVGNMTTPDGKNMKATLTTIYKDANTKTFTLKGAGPDGQEFEMIHITYKRRAK